MPNRTSNVALLAGYLIRGALIEPLVDPKPGAVTRRYRHDDMDIYMFMTASSCLYPSFILVASDECRDGVLGRGFKLYTSCVEDSIGSRNVNSGTAFLLLVLMKGAVVSRRVEDAVSSARYYVEACSGSVDGYYYYKMLGLGERSYMGRYYGPLPDIREPRNTPSLYRILSLTSWDLVHREILESYKISMHVAEELDALGVTEESLLRILLDLLAEYGDTLIARKYGWSAYYRAMAEARQALALSKTIGVREALLWLDSLWRPRKWSPGAILDILASGISLYYLRKYYELNE
ncbi:MAG: triphosphoribosyl-dephospho-CoA synthase [Desulfurococcales archaeon]|nr:triphosphoribosyl-dephospho-CoA synthase [Desulfurococcales archaeon]